MKMIYTIPLVLALAGCGFTKTHLVPQAYMPDPPAILMTPPKELSTIKKNPADQCKTNNNLEICKNTISVQAPK